MDIFMNIYVDLCISPYTYIYIIDIYNIDIIDIYIYTYIYIYISKDWNKAK